MTGIDLIAKERAEQLTKHNRTIAEDVRLNRHHELRRGAIALIAGEGEGSYKDLPSNWDVAACRKMILKSYKERLIIAAALLAAEIDRIQASDSD